VRRAKLYYLRGRVGKAARVAERRWGIDEDMVSKPTAAADELTAVDAEGVSQEEVVPEAAPTEAEQAETETTSEAEAAPEADATPEADSAPEAEAGAETDATADADTEPTAASETEDSPASEEPKGEKPDKSGGSDEDSAG